jgi:hypothetical protein
LELCPRLTSSSDCHHCKLPWSAVIRDKTPYRACTPCSKLGVIVCGAAFVDSGRILADLEPPANNNPGCSLRKVSWVVPDGDRSDHPGFENGQTDSHDIEHGPAWVADVINEVGTTICTDTIKDQQVPYWQDTVIFVTWDDWGGFWDHINPASSAGGPGVLINDPTKNNCLGWGCGYVYGFRVPLLVVSAYTGTQNWDGSYSGYVSGACQAPGNCQNETFPYLHDFGSILAFIENNFLGFGQIGQINPKYPFADAFAPDYQANPPHVPLAEFFPLTSPRPFQSITIPAAWQYLTPDYFMNYNGSLWDPDNDGIDND